jgi:hypothetical protein
MSQHWIYINSASYRRFIEASKEKRGLLFATGAALGGISMLIGYLVANATNPNFEAEGYKDKQAELAKLPMHAQVRLAISVTPCLPTCSQPGSDCVWCGPFIPSRSSVSLCAPCQQ